MPSTLVARREQLFAVPTPELLPPNAAGEGAITELRALRRLQQRADEGDQASFDRRVALRRAALPPEAAQGWQPQLKLPGGVGKLNEAQPQPPQANNLPTDLPTDTNMRIAALKQLGTNNPAALEAARALIGRQQLEGQAQGNLPIQPALHLQRDLSHGPLLNPLGPPQGAPADILAKLQGAQRPLAKGEPGGLTFNKALGRWTTDQPTTDTLPKPLPLASGEYQGKLPGIGGGTPIGTERLHSRSTLEQTLPQANWKDANKIKLGRQGEGGINQSYHIPNLQDPSGLSDWFAKSTTQFGDVDKELATIKLGRELGLNMPPAIDLGDRPEFNGRTVVSPWIPHTKFREDNGRATQAIAAMTPAERSKQLLFEYMAMDSDKHAGNWGATMEPEGQSPQLLNFDYGGALMGGPRDFTGRNQFVRMLQNDHANEHIDRGALNEILAQRDKAMATYKQAHATRSEMQDLQDRFEALQALSKSKATVLPTYSKFIKSIGNQ